MRKILSFALALVLIMTMLPMCVLAAEDAPNERAELIALACEVFPEYAPMILGDISPFSAYCNPNGPADVVYQETRSISNTEEITLARYSNGATIIIEQSEISSHDIIETSANEKVVTNGVAYTLSYKIAATSDFVEYYPGVLYISNFKATVYDSGYDKINSYGTISVNNSSYCTRYPVVVYSLQETASNAASVHYPFQFHSPGNSSGTFPGSLAITVRNNEITVSLK
ncbi:MAG: hypothetical protein Q4F17_09130 [Eubacteriales bacterium]|nr:hypothetical protein [Eubacteriales bacterium]